MNQSLNPEDFTHNARVQAAAERARQRLAAAPMSDLVDAAGHQYVDLVMEGGGVLGIALAGYTYVLEQAGLRFLGIAGTSAGSINALMLAGLGTPEQQKGVQVATLLAAMPMAEFIDGDGDARDITDAIVNKASMFKMLWKALQVVDNLKDDLGLHPGRRFQQWVAEALAEHGMTTMAQLQARLETPPQGGWQKRLQRDDHPDLSHLRGKLKIIAADVTMGRKLVLPDMMPLYWPAPETCNPAEMVRTSMSVPFFFTPAVAREVPQGPEAVQRWKDTFGYAGTLPTRVLFVDGGVISNFPISVFHDHRKVPLAPTFGVKLELDATMGEDIREPSKLLFATFNAARHALDEDFIQGNPDYRHLVQNIDTGHHHWLNFEMSAPDKLDLFVRGAEAAADFLQGFDWPHYKQLRGVKATLRQMDQQ